MPSPNERFFKNNNLVSDKNIEEVGDLLAKMNSHSLDDLLLGKYPVSVVWEGLSRQRAKKLGLLVKTVRGVTVVSKSEAAARPMLDFLAQGGEYGTPQFSRLLGYTESDIQDYCRLMELTGNGQDVYRIYCDMDGVLVDFETSITAFVNTFLQWAITYPPTDPKLMKAALKAVKSLGGDLTVGDVPTIPKSDFERPGNRAVRNLGYRLIEEDAEFWANMAWMPDGPELWGYIRRLKPEPWILSAPMGTPSEYGKRTWVKDNISPSIRVITDRGKWQYVNHDPTGRIGLLIDDSSSNIDAFREHGGKAILHTSTKETIKELKQHGM